MSSLLFVLFGVIAGLLGALLGIGGGIILIPIMHVGMDLPIHQSIFTSLLCVCMSSSMVISTRIKDGAINFQLVSLMESISLVAGFLGAYLSVHLPEKTVAFIFSITMFAMALIVALLRPKSSAFGANVEKQNLFRSWFFESKEKKWLPYAPLRPYYLLLIGLLSGTLSGLLGIGGGIIAVPLMMLIGGLPAPIATSTSSYLMCLTSAGALVFYAQQDSVDILKAVPALIGVLLGVKISRKIDLSPSSLRWALFVLLLIVGYKLWIKSL